MKKITINNAKGITDTGDNEDARLCQFEVEGPEEMDASDGYHTFTELYEHRYRLFIALCRYISDTEYGCGPECGRKSFEYSPWRSKYHGDGSPAFEGWFIMGIGKKPGEQITYHLPSHLWENTAFAETLDQAPEYDGHTAADVLTRLNKIL